MAEILILKEIDLVGIQREMLDGAADGIEAAVQESVFWIKNNVILGQEFVGDANYPDVKPATKKQKARRGKAHVLIQTGNLKDSFIGEVKGLEGKITGGGDLGYAGKLFKKWKIDALWKEKHAKVVYEIIREYIKRRL
jgi:uncharacterized protein YjbJ (UPF0337 family)